MSNSDKLKLLEVVTNKLNPPYKKEITPLNSLGIPGDLIDKAKKYNINLRGLEEPLKIDNEMALQELPNVFETNSVRSIAKINNKTLAFGGDDRQVTIVDIIDQYNPNIIGCIESNGSIYNIAYIDNKTLAFGGDDNRVTIVDISDRANPKVIGSIDSTDWIYSITTIDEKTLAFGGKDRKVTIMDISNIADVTVIGSIDSTGEIKSISKINDKTLAFSGKNDGVTIISINDKNNIKEINQFFYTGLVNFIACMDNKILSFAGKEKILTNVDINNNNEVGYINSEKEVYCIEYIDDKTLVFGQKDGKVNIVNINNRSSPKITSSLLSLEYMTYEVSNNNNLCFVNLKGWQIDNDPKLYTYARLYDLKTKVYVPYYMLKKRIIISNDNKKICIRKKY